MAKIKITYDKAVAELKKGFTNAKNILSDEGKLGRFIKKFSESWKSNSFAKNTVKNVELLFDLVKDYKNGIYKKSPTGTIVAAISALVYVIDPFDLIPDAIPGIGVLDDAAVVFACVKFIKVDLDNYKKWLEKHPKKSTDKEATTKTETKSATKSETKPATKATNKKTTSKAKTSVKKVAPTKKVTTKKSTPAKKISTSKVSSTKKTSIQKVASTKKTSTKKVATKKAKK